MSSLNHTGIPGYLLCDGSSYSTTSYSNLYAVIGTRYGSGTGTFKVPNLIDKFIKGVNADSSGSTGGDSSNHTHNLTPNISISDHTFTNYASYYNYRHYHYTAHEDGNCSSNMYVNGGSHAHDYAGGAQYALYGQYWGGLSAWFNVSFVSSTSTDGAHQHTNGYMAYGSYNFGNTAQTSGDSDAACYYNNYPALNAHTMTNNTVTSVSNTSIPSHYRCYYFIKY
jgi:microcystin-dependent protein